ncbi:polysaccharide biosynthesis tyrosine autokinase [Rhizobium sp. FKL33]|uniref:polysaccharide biosynthesis tyrosine autokinase n=1 Tax=Rhizobium sp. FKL33 TaxID=2562307 RepID=UPI0010BFA550|nr:polysaccharide biosynthesis tyrosine autokinase [Rhizobium sp. FKL33]
MALAADESNSEFEQSIDFEALLAVARRQWRVVAVAGVAGILLGIAYIVTAVPLYTSSASLLIDSGNQKIVDQLSAVSGVLEDEASVLSQVELLKSEKIAQAVSDKLDLKNDKLFMASKTGPLQSVIAIVRSFLNVSSWFSKTPDIVSNEATQRSILDTLSSNLAISRVGRTYVLQLSYTSPDPGLSAKIARSYAEAYLTDQLDSKYDATRRASDWLQQRIGELRQKSLETDMAVQRFRAEKGLIATDGKLVTDQQLAQLTSQLIVAQAETANADARYQRIKSIIDSGQLDAAVTDSIESAVITTLREKFLEASRKEADITNRLGSRHVQAIRLRTEMSEYKRLMFEELSRIAESYRSTYAVARDRQKNLEDQVAQAKGISASANDSQVQLRELEREAETYKNLYQTFLQRYQEAIQQQSFPVTEARIITNPSIPEKPSAPKKPLVLTLSALLGLMAGAGIGAFREFRDRFFRTGDQISSALGLEFLGTIPLAADAGPVKSADTSHKRAIIKTSKIADQVIDHPLSAFAETLRSAKIAVDIYTGAKKPKIIGLVSVLPGEGKSTVSVNFAELLAVQGARVLLIDADLRNPGATRMLGRHAEAGVLEVIQDGASVWDLLLVNPKTKLAFLPAIVKRRIPYSSELLASEGMDRLLAQASERFDYIVVDLPPLAPVVDARAVASKMDAFLFVVEWGRTARNVVRKTLEHSPTIVNKCAGVVLNKVDNNKMKLYQQYGSSEYYYSRYSSYYRED